MAYLAFGLIGCSSGPGLVVPVDAAPVERGTVVEWVSATVPLEQRLHRFKWLFQDERSSAGGRGSARIAPPDSLRFDVAGPFGSGAASAAIVGDSLLWADPPDAVTKLVPNYPLLWAMFGVARLPEDTDSLIGVSRDGLTAWRYVSGADTVSYVRTTGTTRKLVTEVRHAGQLVGRAETTLGGNGAPLTARLLVPSVPAKLALTFLSTARAEFAPDIWTARRH
ncbi:MAG: hypothetical protein ABI766_03805 [Gemmatimonadales bacterium]